MAQELLINVNVSGEEQIPKLDDNLKKINDTTKKTTNAMLEMRKEVKQAKSDLLTFAEGTKEYDAALQKAAAAADRMRNVQDKIKASQKDIGVVSKNVAGSIAGMAGAFSTAQGVMALFGIENDNTAKAILKIQSVMAVTSGIAQFADSLDSMKDLYNGLKINILAMIAAKQKETVVTVENTVANTAEAGAITAVGTSTKITTKAVLAALGPYALISAAIAGVIALVVKMIKNINEVPKDIKLNIELDEKVSSKMEDEFSKVMKFAYDYNREVKLGNKERIKQLEEIGKKDFDLSNEKLKLIAKSKDAWRDAFKDYLDLAKLSYKEEILIKKNAESEVNRETLYNQQKLLKQRTIEARATLVSKFKYRGEGLAKLIESGSIGAALYSLDSDEAKKYAQLITLLKQTDEQFQISVDNAITNGTNLRRFEKENEEQLKKLHTNTVTKPLSTKSTTTDKKTFEPYKKEFTMEDAIAEFKSNQKIREDVQIKYGEKFGGGTLFGTEKDFTYSLDVLKTQFDQGLLSEKDYLEQKYVLLRNSESLGNTLAETSFLTRQQLRDLEQTEIENMVQKGQELLSSIGNITDSIVNMYEYRLQALDNYYNAEQNNIETSTLSEEEKNKKLQDLDQERYEKQKELFEQQKKYQIASAWINFASGVVTMWSEAAKLGPIAGPIVAAAETAAFLATTIAQTDAIAKQEMTAPIKNNSSSSSTIKSSSSASVVALNPTASSMTTRDENLNMMNRFNKSTIENVVKVSDINNIQNKVKVRETNSSY